LPHYLRTFVLHIAVLERFCAPLCDALVLSGASESHYSQVLIEQISRMNLFVIPLDDARRWYRFHHLFADVLRGRLKDGANPDTIVELHRRASHWYQHQELIHEAIYHAMEANAPEVAADIIEARGHSVIARGELTTVIGWIRALPESVFHERPRLLLTLAWALPNTGAIDDVLRYLAMAEAIIARKPDQLLQSECSAIRLAPMVLQEHNAEASALGVEILQYLPPNHMFRPITSVITGVALFRQGRFAEAVQLLSQAVVESRAAKALFYLIPSHDFLAAIARERGDFAEAERKYQQSLDKSKGSEGTVLPLAGMPLVGLGRLRWLQGQWEAAEQAYVEGLRLCVLLNAAAFYFMEGYIGLAEIRRTQGRYAEALELLSVLEDRVRVLGNPVFLDTITAHRVRVWLMQKEDAAVRWLNEHNLQRGSTLVFVREDEYVTLIRVLLTTGQLDTAFAWLDEVEALARAEGRMRSVVDLLVLRAVAHYTQQDRERANAVVLQALDLAAPMNYISAFVSEGTPVAALLREAHARNIYPGYCERLLAAFSHAEHVVIPEQPAKPRQSTTLLPEPLNERELEVLRLIAQGHSNQQIADRLVVAISTVKWHINNLYGKLGVGTRTQALARATQLGLL
jgi:LuxR family maltose regulon positive regulatory protein